MISNSGSLRWSSLKGVAALLLAPLGLAAGSAKPAPAQSRIKVLLVTGQSNRYHNWDVSSPIVARQLEDSGRFTVTVATTPAKGAAPNQDMSSFAPTFSDDQLTASADLTINVDPSQRARVSPLLPLDRTDVALPIGEKVSEALC